MSGRQDMDLTKEELVNYSNGGRVVVYNAIDRNTEDFKRIFQCAIFFARQGREVIMPPKIDVPFKNSAYEKKYGFAQMKR